METSTPRKSNGDDATFQALPVAVPQRIDDATFQALPVAAPQRTDDDVICYPVPTEFSVDVLVGKAPRWLFGTWSYEAKKCTVRGQLLLIVGSFNEFAHTTTTIRLRDGPNQNTSEVVDGHGTVLVVLKFSFVSTRLMLEHALQLSKATEFWPLPTERDFDAIMLAHHVNPDEEREKIAASRKVVRRWHGGDLCF
ncbi:Aste57867_14731 [Aphanomyces stellatus]|uniref:Aste57867_14731 protein n=1 Tax=Aphanomyces stellatus TaxID=120398 RepID=A0A485L1G2_9STRA|nr:hypothetical protein As57867_014676 [Aphanomyces stellatus]VFT91549.1 Aste57867_14731 [Aphanomyces stellatus]